MLDPAMLASLYDVLQVARQGSVVAAAESLHKTASAVSQQLRRVEDHFGVALFERRGRGVCLSASGHAIIPKLERLFDQAQEVQRGLVALSGTQVATLRVAVSDYLGRGLLVPVMASLAEAGCPLRFEIVSAHSLEAPDLLERRQVDIALVTGGRVQTSLQEHELFEQPLFWVGSKQTRFLDGGTSFQESSNSRSDASFSNQDETRAWASSEDIRNRLISQPVVRLRPGSMGRKLLDTYLQREGIQPISTIDVPSVTLLVDYARGGVGLGLVPALAALILADAHNVLAPSGMGTLSVRWLMRMGDDGGPAMSAFLDALAAEGTRVGERLAAAGLLDGGNPRV